MEIIAITTEVIIFGHNDFYIEVSGRTSAWSNFALTSELHSISSLNSRRNGDIHISTDANATIAGKYVLSSKRDGHTLLVMLARAAARQRSIGELTGSALSRLARKLVELFGALQQRYRRTAIEGVKRLLKKDLKGLGDTERAAIETWAEVLARRFAHIPCLGLRGLLHDGPDGSIEAFLSGLEPEFADELRAALKGAAEAPKGEAAATERLQ